MNSKELFFEEIVERGLKLKNYDSKYNSRHRSWEICRNNFLNHKKEKSTDKDFLCLNLAFYLASWGMYRGSSAILFNDYKIHQETIEYLLQQNEELWNYNPFDDDKNLSRLNDDFFNRDGDLWGIYNVIKKETNYPRKTDKSSQSPASETLITKILIGTLGCIPAYDEFFIKGLKYVGLNSEYTKANIITIVEKLKEDKKVKNFIENQNQFTPMKIIDAYFWEIGYELWLIELLQDEKKKLKKLNYIKNYFCENDVKGPKEMMDIIKKMLPKKKVLK